MKTDNELFVHIYNSSKIGVNSLTNLLNEIKTKENKLKKIIEDELKEYEKFLKESEKILKKEDIDLKDESLMMKMTSKYGMKKEVLNDNSDAKIAQILMQGFTMGVIEIESKIDTYKDAVSKKDLNFAKDYLKFQQDEIEKLKKYI